MHNFAERRRHKKSMKKFFFLIILLVLIIGGIGAWWINGISPADPSNQKVLTFQVSQGEGVRQIANSLKAKGLIKDAVVFYFLVKQQGIGGKIQAGEFQLSPSMSASDVASVLQVATDDVRITIPEGKRAEEIAETLKEHFPSYQSSWDSKLIANEGYLFPDTYSFHKDSTIDVIISTMRGNFDKKYASINDSKKSNLSQSQIVIIASIVEREARFPEDRPLVASVILNRLTAGMPLQVDATEQYAIGTSSNWWPVLTDTGGNTAPSSSYNTYTHPGLPPAPISNPGLESLKAVIEAPQTNYLFYVSDKSGHNHYEVTYQQQLQDQQKYGIGD